MGIAYGLMFIGFVGTLLPIVPGTLLIWLGAVAWAVADGFQAVGWPTLIILGSLALLAWGSDLTLTTLNSRRAGTSWKSLLGAILGGLTGRLLPGGFIPVVGTLLAPLGGSIAGVAIIEYYTKQNRNQALQASRAYLAGSIAASVVSFFLALAMLGTFFWQVFS